MFITELRLKNYSSQDRKRIAAQGSSDGYKINFYADTPPKIIEYVKMRERDAGLLWCEKHNEWEPIDESCNEEDRKFVRPEDEYKDIGSYQQKGGDYEDDLPEYLKKRVSEAKGKGLGGEQGDKDEKQQDEYFKRLVEVIEEENKKKQAEKKQEDKAKLQEFVGKKIKKTNLKGSYLEDGDTIKSVSKSPMYGGSMTAKTTRGFAIGLDEDGNVYSRTSQDMMGKVGVVEGSKAQQQGGGESGEQQQQQSKQKWTKILLNRCPHCATETLKKLKMPPPAPMNPMDALDYTENACGCERLKDIFKSEEIPF